MELTQLLRDQKQELEGLLKKKRIIEREAEKYFKDSLNSKLIKVISGIRRCGKSVFIYNLLKDKKFAYMNFDDERLVNFNTDQVISSFYEIYGKDFKIIFFDEIQNLDKWELFVNRLHRNGFNLFLTGSNAKLLSRELATHLTGRHIKKELFPFSFKEYLKMINFNEDIKTTRGDSLLKHELNNYLRVGGFPEIIAERENPRTYLRELYTNIIEKDIISRYGISYKKTFKELSIVLLSNPSTKISYNKLKKHFNIKSEHTIKNYINYLQESYLIHLVNRFSHKPVEIEKSEKKVYVIDSGIINNVSLNINRSYGSLYENMVAVELLRRISFNQDMEISYWKNVKHEEVDFIVKEGQKVKELIQVCCNLDDMQTKEREIRSLLKASKELKCNNLLIITEDKKGEEIMDNKRLRYIPLYQWLLEDGN